MTKDWRDAVFRIDSEADASPAFGTGFVCHREGDRAFLLTSDHVLTQIGEDHARVLQLPIEVVARGDDTLDLALIAVVGLHDSPVLPLSNAGDIGQPFVAYGHTWLDPSDRKSGRSLARPLDGRLGAETAFTSLRWPKVRAWDLPFDEDDRFAELLEGYSGSPVWDPRSESVIAVVSHRRSKKMGYSIAVSNLRKIYPAALRFFRPHVSPLRDSARSQDPQSAQPIIDSIRAKEADRDQTPLEPPSGREFFESIRKALISLFSHSRLAEAAQLLVGISAETEPAEAVDLLLQLEPLEAINRWNEVVTELYDKTSIIGAEQRDFWFLLESVHLYLLPRLVDLTRLSKDSRFPQDALLFTIAAPHEPPNRPVELLFARMNRNRVVQFEQRGQHLARDFAVPCTALDMADPALGARAEPDIESLVEQVGFKLMERFYMTPPEQMRPYDWKKLDAKLKAGRRGKRGFYLVIPHASHDADPALLSSLYHHLPNLPKFLMAEAVGDDLPFVCEPVDIDAAIEEFWDLKIRWCG